MHNNKQPIQINCPVCEENSLSENIERDQFPFGVDRTMLEADVPVLTCNNCGFEFTDSRAEEARHIAACEFQGLLSHIEIREIRKRIYGMSRKEFSETFGFGEASLSRWENRNVFQNLQTDNFLRLLRDTKIGNTVCAFRHSDTEEKAPQAPIDNVIYLDKFQQLKPQHIEMIKRRAFAFSLTGSSEALA